ncbi:beta-1,3-galactosyl-O-glycosyl-glycoprotein beta-1,6-N-acetylglucosaminyltransferase-like [Physella acuta]|uniref:beta-1,3-galactosyl-O-glycosyl-glycoprotein beta-1,6-N-acetylglucosaminyltransferase-like n=1 Tax=Physella acuta TaxID=109671 RepID=UPI0027DCC1C4|nr:beta-1,3-galactosyl-O-glycosyl-glycoprotein beta-1,6-N-acetylglucosaminyltransferase-like [Physella acuta]
MAANRLNWRPALTYIKLFAVVASFLVLLTPYLMLLHFVMQSQNNVQHHTSGNRTHKVQHYLSGNRTHNVQHHTSGNQTHSVQHHLSGNRIHNIIKPPLATAAEWLLNMSTIYSVKDTNCAALIAGDKQILHQTLQNNLTKSPKAFNDDFYIDLTSDCVHFKRYRGYIDSFLSQEERDFPLAFSILVYKDVEMVERLLRSIYRPQNYYCIHVDKKSPIKFYQAVSAIAKCFPNVFMTSRRIDVTWGKFSVLEPEILCMEDLWRYKKWRYYINLTGQEFPLKTNGQLVKILKAFNGSNDMAGSLKRVIPGRFYGTMPPLGIRPVKGQVHVVVNRYFVDYILHNETAHTLLNWTRSTHVPDETFFVTLNYNPQLGIRGTFKGDPDHSSYVNRYKVWRQNINNKTCAGQFVRDICILTIGDLPSLTQSMQLFANKFFQDVDSLVIGCLEEKLFNETRDEYLGLKTFDASGYKKLRAVLNQVT